MLRQVTRILAILIIATAALSYSGAQSGSKGHRLKGSVDGFLEPLDGNIFGASFNGGTISGFGNAYVSIGILVADASPDRPYGRVVINRIGNQNNDQLWANLDGTSIDTPTGTLYFGTGVVTGGIGKYASATGTFTWTAELTGVLGSSLDNTVFTFDGSVAY